MTELVKKRGGQIIAARIHAYAPDRLPPFGKPELRALWKHAGDLGLAVQLHFEPRYAPGFEPLIREFPKTTVIIDHLGRPFQGTPQEYAVVLGWSTFPNTVMKLSSLPEKGQYPHRDVGPVILDLVKRFGPDRLIYGGGFGAGATGDSYRGYREKVRSYLTDLSAGDQAKVLGGTAARVFGFRNA
jgi:predicted TIM-barrel fold metal-dependent hydrolase